MAAPQKPTAATMYKRALILLTLLMVENVVTEVRPMVTFSPDTNKIFKGESMSLTCDVDSDVEGDVTYHWFKDGSWIGSGKTLTISSAETSNSGNYQCQSTGEKSDLASLEVYTGYVILQAPPYVYEGDNLTLQCRHYPGYPAKQTIFYKNGEVIQDWGPEDEFHIQNVDVTSSSKYGCTKQVQHNLLYYQHSGDVSVSVQELFSLPTIRLSPLSVTEGDPMTLTCHTRLSLLRQATVLQFAFYQEGENIQEFSSSNKYEVLSAKRSDSGDYKCEVRMSIYQMEKRSTILTVQVRRNGEQELFNESETEETSQPGPIDFITAGSVTCLGLVLAIVVGLIFLYRRNYFRPGNSHQPSKVEREEPDEKTENIYTDLETTHSWQNSSQNLHEPKGNDLVTKNLFIV